MKNYANIAKKWARKYSKPRADTCLHIRQAANRFLSDLKKSKNKNYPYLFLPSKVAAACYFIEQLPHVRGRTWSGQKLILEDWQIFFIANIFGWINKDNHQRRRFSEVWLEVARKNGKSSLAAGICLYMFCADGELGPEIVCVATKRDQARMVFDTALAMARRMPELVDYFQIDVGSNEAIMEQNGIGSFAAYPSNADKLDGLNPYVACLDEVHAMRTPDLRDVLRTAMGSREQGLLLEITTAGSDMDGVGFWVHSYAQQVMSGELDDPSFFGMIFALDKGDAWDDPKVWKKANPNLGVSVFKHDFEAMARQAKGNPAELNSFLQKKCNIWTNEGSAWIPADAWQACADKNLRLADFYPENNGGEPRRAWGGLDLAAHSDLSAFVLMIPEFGEEIYSIDKLYVWAWCWLPQFSPSREKGVENLYQNYLRGGGDRLILTAENQTDFTLIEKHVFELSRSFNIMEIGFDPYGAIHLSQRLRAGLVSEEGQRVVMDMVEVRQGALTFHQPMEFLKACILDKKLIHENDFLLNWQIHNVETTPPDANGNMRPAKSRGSKKIDAPVAMINAMARLLPFVEQRGIVGNMSTKFQEEFD